jgi:hypothetical protein
MKLKSLVASLIALFLLSTASNALSETDILGWGEAKWGMTYSQVSKLYDLGDWDFPNIRNWHQCHAKRSVNIQGLDFKLSFLFDEKTPNGKLYGVLLINIERNPKNDEIYDGIASLLASKYGKPESVIVDDTSLSEFSAVRTSLWLRKSGQTELKIIIHPDHGSTCKITYVSVGSDIDKI